MNVVVIGGTKSIGAAAVRELAAAGHSVTAYHRGTTEAPLPADVRHVHSPHAGIPVTSFSPELFDPPPEVVIHMIAMGEADARAALKAFAGIARRMVVISSGDVYAAYGRLARLETGAPFSGLLHEDAPRRTVLCPYRSQASSTEDWTYHYEKILVEQVVRSDARLESVILRLPKVYGPADNADLATMYAFRRYPDWRWTHGYVDNVAHAIVLGATHPAAARQTYNVGEEYTPTVAERLAALPTSDVPDAPKDIFDFRHSIAYDTSKIRRELGYKDIVAYEEGICRTLAGRQVP